MQTKSTLSAPKLSFDTNEFYLKDSGEMASDFAAWPESIATTLEIAERCQVDIELGKMLIPRFPAPGRRDARRTTSAGSRTRGCASATATRRRPPRSSGSRWSWR